jgi:hypothetical protein
MHRPGACCRHLAASFQRRRRGIVVESHTQKPQAPQERHLLYAAPDGAKNIPDAGSTKISPLTGLSPVASSGLRSLVKKRAGEFGDGF